MQTSMTACITAIAATTSFPAILAGLLAGVVGNAMLTLSLEEGGKPGLQPHTISRYQNFLLLLSFCHKPNMLQLVSILQASCIG